MEKTVQDKIDFILDRVKEEQSGMSAAQLGIVQKVRFHEGKKGITIFLHPMGRMKSCCSVMNMMFLENLENLMKEAFNQEFPGFSIQFVNA